MKKFKDADQMFESPSEMDVIPPFLKESVVDLLGHWPEMGIRARTLSFGKAYQLMTSEDLENFRNIGDNLEKIFSPQFPEVFLAYGSEQMDNNDVSINFIFKSQKLIFILQTRAPVLAVANSDFVGYEEKSEKATENFFNKLKYFSILAGETKKMPTFVAPLCHVYSEFL
ncbi:MAG: hypothetical protein LBI34_04080 [Puniceicoccales bacterium]|jgi:hypothetical protein|nr:hypothetical protein [Puniceicoccales bacterium]